MIVKYDLKLNEYPLQIRRSEKVTSTIDTHNTDTFTIDPNSTDAFTIESYNMVAAFISSIIRDARYLKECKLSYDESVGKLKDSIIKSVSSSNDHRSVMSSVHDAISKYNYNTKFTLCIAITYNDYQYDIIINPDDTLLDKFTRIDARVIPAILDSNMSNIENELTNNEFDTNEINDIMLKLYKLISYINRNVSEYYC